MRSKRAQCVRYVPMSSRCISVESETQMFTIVIIKCSLCDGHSDVNGIIVYAPWELANDAIVRARSITLMARKKCIFLSRASWCTVSRLSKRDTQIRYVKQATLSCIEQHRRMISHLFYKRRFHGAISELQFLSNSMQEHRANTK